MTHEFSFNLEGDADDLVPLDDGQPGFRLQGLHGVEGTFSGKLEDGVVSLFDHDVNVQTVYMYGPDPNMPLVKHWFYRILERLFEGSRWFPEFPYPTIVLASGPATMNWEQEREDGEDVVFSGTFTSAGKWYFHDDEASRP